MANTPDGAKKAVETMRKKYGDEFFKKRAHKAGKQSSGGFELGSNLAREAGRKGAMSRWQNTVS